MLIEMAQRVWPEMREPENENGRRGLEQLIDLGEASVRRVPGCSIHTHLVQTNLGEVYIVRATK